MTRNTRARGMRGSSRVTWNEIEQLRRRVRELELTRERLSRLYFSQVEAGKARMEKLHRLLEVVTQLNSTLELDTLLNGIVRAVQVTLGFRVVLLRVLDPETKRLEARAFAGLGLQAVAKLESEDVALDTFLSWLSDEFRVGRSYFISHMHAFSNRLPEGVRSNLGRREPWEWHEDDVLLVPLYTKSGEVVGYLSVDDPVDRLVPSRETIELLEVFANHVVVALDNARLYQSLEDHSHRLEEANARLGELTRLKSNFLSAISHELRTPLASIRAYADSLRDTSQAAGSGGDPEAWQRSLEVVAGESARLEELIDSVLSFSALESGAGPQAVPVQLADLLSECAVLLEPAATTKGVALRLEVPSDETLLVGDRELLKQLVLQLGGNAIKFTPNRGEVVIGLTLDERAAHLFVRDTGIGIPAEELGRIFERFYQIDGGLSRQFGGTGLGLAICKSVAEWHGGHIAVQSRPGQGSCFTVELPRTPRPRAEVWSMGPKRREGGEQALGLALEVVAEVTGATCAALLTRQGDELLPRAAVGLPLDELRGLRLREGEGIAGHVLSTGQSIDCRDAERDPRFVGHRREPYRKGQVLAVPVRPGERETGVLVVGFEETQGEAGEADNPKQEPAGSPADSRLRLAEMLGERVGGVVARVERMRQGEAEAQVAVETLKSVLVHLRRDQRHAPERSRTAERVARAMGMGQRETAQVAFAALLMDVALSRPEAAALPEEMLPSEAEAMRAIAVAPPGELAARLERELEQRGEALDLDLQDESRLRRHPEAGVEILAPLEIDGPVRQMVLTHHEWVNGHGYPKGLTGNQIPTGAKVLAVVDAFESLLLGRVGRPGVSAEEAVEELRRLGGQRFDPRVVEALEGVLVQEGRLEAGRRTASRAA